MAGLKSGHFDFMAAASSLSVKNRFNLILFN